MHEVVKYSNDLSNHSFSGMTSGELNLFMTICSRAREQNGNIVELTFNEIKKLAQYKSKDNIRLGNDIMNTNRKLLKQDWMLYDEAEDKTTQFAIFDKFEVFHGSHKVNVSIRKEFQYLLNDLLGDFTRFELAEFVALKSKYSKEVYRQLKRYRDTGYWYIELHEFKRLLDIPKSYKPGNIDQKVLSPVLEELQPVFNTLIVEKIHTKQRGNPLKAYEFHFKSEKRWKDEKEILINVLSTQTCPACGLPLIEKTLNGSLCWCHSDGWKENTKCKLIFNSVAEIKNYNEPPAEPQQKKRSFAKLFGIK